MPLVGQAGPFEFRGGRVSNTIDCGFRIEDDPKAAGGKTITCLGCEMKSYNAKDVEHRYCGNCKAFHV